MIKQWARSFIQAEIQRHLKSFIEALQRDIRAWEIAVDARVDEMDKRQHDFVQRHERHAVQVESYLAGFNQLLKKLK